MLKNYLIFIIYMIGLWYIATPLENEDISVSTNVYYTNERRNIITDRYYIELQKQNCPEFLFFNIFCFLKPFKIIHPANLAASYFDSKQKSTYLEEYFYPLRGSIIVNGYEPYNEKGEAFNKYSEPLISDNKQYNSQVTVKLNNSSIFNRVLIYILIWIIIYWLTKSIKVIVFRN